MNFKAKVIFGNDTRVWRTTEPTFSGLLAFVQGAWVNSLPNQWKLQYNDTDGDNVTITSQMDLADCLQTMSENQDKGLRIVVSDALPSGPTTVVAAAPMVTPVPMDSESVDMDYEIIRGGSETQSLPEEAADPITEQNQEFMGDEKEEPTDPKVQARTWAEERINAGRVPIPEQLESNFKLSPIDSTQIITDLTPAIHDLLAIQAAQAPEPEGETAQQIEQTQAERPTTPTGMDLEELRAKLMSLGFNIQGSEEAMRTAVRALTNPNIVIDATAYVEPPAEAEGPTSDGTPCGWRDILKQFVEDDEAVAGLTGSFVDVLYACIQEGEDTMVAMQSAVASDEHLADATLVKKLMPFLAGYSDKLTRGLAFVTMMGADALRNLLNTAVTTARTYLSGDEAAWKQCPLFNMSSQFFPGIHNVFQQFMDANSVPEVRRDDQGRVVHMGVVCDGCGMDPVVGVRYKSAVRPDYDLCGNCEQTRDDRHHPMLKYEFPAAACNKHMPGLREAFRAARRHAGGRGRGRGGWRGGWGGCGRWGKWARENFGRGRNNGNAGAPNETPRGPPHHPPHHGWGGWCHPPHPTPQGPPHHGPPRGHHPWGPPNMGAFFKNMMGGRGGGCPWMGGRGGGNTMNDATPNDNGVITVHMGEYKARNLTNVDKVIEARYGDLKVGPFASAKDVTAKVQEMLRLSGDNMIRLVGVRSLNQHFGDPAVGITKKLRVRYIPVSGEQPQQEDEIFSVTIDQRPMGFRYDGVKVTSVWRQGRAWKAGLRSGQTVVMINGQDADPDTITTIYRSAKLPFEIVLSRQQQVPTKIRKLDDKINQMSRQTEKLKRNLTQTDKKEKKSEKQIAKVERQVQKQQKQLQKQVKKLEKGKGGVKLPEKVEKTAAKLSKQAANLEKRKAKHAEFVQRLETKRNKMQSKLRKMEDKLSKMNDKREKALQDDIVEQPSSGDEEPTVEVSVEEYSKIEVEVPQREDTELVQLEEPKEWTCPSCGMHNHNSARCGSCGQDRPTKLPEPELEEPPSDDDADVKNANDDAKEQEDPAPKTETFHVAVDHPYYEQNTALVNMGFTDEVHNIHLLAQCDGNLQQTISQLVDASAHNI